MSMFTAIVSVSDNKVSKYAEFETLAEATSHVETHGGFVHNGQYSRDMVVSADNVVTLDSSWANEANAELNRGERNYLLQETDWWAVGDRTMTPAETNYRQALRDITSHANWPNLLDTDWPTKP